MTKQEEIREGIARKLAFYACKIDWENLTPFGQQVYLDQALVIMEYEVSQGVVIKVKRELPLVTETDVTEWCSATRDGISVGQSFMVEANYVAVGSLINDK